MKHELTVTPTMNSSRPTPHPQQSQQQLSEQQQRLTISQQKARLARIQRHREQLLHQQLQQRKAEFVSNYDLPLKYPANVAASSDNGEDSDTITTKKKGLRTSSNFINARLLESGLPLGASSANSDKSTTTTTTTLADHSTSIGRFIRDLEGTGCYESVQVHLSPSSLSDSDSNSSNNAAQQQSSLPSSSPLDYDVTVQLKEKKWYKLYIGGGVNSDDLSSLGTANNSGGAFGSGGSSGMSALSSALPKLQFETSASLLNLTGYADMTSASYSVDQTGATTLNLVHDQPLVSYLSKGSGLYDWLMPADPRLVDTTADIDNNIGNETSSKDGGNELDEEQVYETDDSQYSLGGGSHTTLGMHATIHDVDYEYTRSAKEFVRSVGVRLANHSRGSGAGGSGGYKPSISPPESMGGPYLFLDWNASLRDVLPKRSPTSPFVLDCSPEIAKQSGTYFKHSLTSGMYFNGCFVDDRYDPTMGYDAHLVGEVAGPPGDVGYWKVKGGYSWHFPVELARMMLFGVNDDDIEENGGYIEREGEDSPSVIGMALHSSFNCGVIRPLTFNGLVGSNNSNGAVIPSSDRFYVGGPGQLRGFLPAGIGPRSIRGGSSVPGGDALGGDLFYTSTLATSVPFPSYFASLRENGARAFGFVNAGTCVSTSGTSLLGMGCIPVWSQILQSTRVAVGGGISVGSPMGRFEATYAVPIRYGPRDARKSVQFGFGFSFG